MGGPELFGPRASGETPSDAMSVSWAPGRVNLIGEHIDYHDLPVLPMALQRGVRIVFRRRRDGEVVLANTDAEFEPRRFALDSGLSPWATGDWGNYLKAGALTVLRLYGVEHGIEGEVSSDLPPAAGLSSSSALVVAVANALLHANGVRAEPLDLAEALARGEQFVGTAGGGMDQAASLTGVAGHAIRIAFRPLMVSRVPFPEDWVVLVAHTGVRAEKSGGAQAAYNERRAESTRALKELSRRMAGEVLPPSALLERFDSGILLERCAGLAAPGGPWAAHALSEAVRVDQAVDALRDADLMRFGRLLNESHRSLRDVYGVSHPRLDSLVEAAVEAGAAGARLSGAGFGGCMLAVTHRDLAGRVEAALEEAQAAMDPKPGLPPFVAQPGDGARVIPG